MANASTAWGVGASVALLLCAVVLLTVACGRTPQIEEAGLADNPALRVHGKLAFVRNNALYVIEADGSAERKLADLMWGTTPSWSPDGRWLAYVSDPGRRQELRIIRVDGTTEQTLISEPRGVLSDPRWSPDGTTIAFVSGGNGDREIEVIGVDGTGRVRLTENSAGDYSPVWSPDGSRIAFTSERMGSPEIYLMDADGTGQTRLTESGAADLPLGIRIDWRGARLPAWSPDGSQIAFVSSHFDGESWFDTVDVVGIDGRGRRMLAHADLFRRRVSKPTWSPDGSSILFATGWIESEHGDAIYSARADGTSTSRLIDEEALGADLGWFPDGAWATDGAKIALTIDRDYSPGGSTFDIYLVNPDGTELLRVTTSEAMSETAPAWQPLPG